eukprot:1746587-Amphidinium_carterae.1
MSVIGVTDDVVLHVTIGVSCLFATVTFTDLGNFMNNLGTVFVERVLVHALRCVGVTEDLITTANK